MNNIILQTLRFHSEKKNMIIFFYTIKCVYVNKYFMIFNCFLLFGLVLESAGLLFSLKTRRVPCLVLWLIFLLGRF